jgi:hypothetical protein
MCREIAIALLRGLDFLDELLDRYRSLLQNATQCTRRQLGMKWNYAAPWTGGIGSLEYNVTSALPDLHEA